ncbi:MAG: hypothetical protein JWQ08_2901, partial [Deinococcus sp.]|nr:hypothetical protein [Deinococcus sp.]
RAVLHREFGMSLDPAFERTLAAQGMQTRT